MKIPKVKQDSQPIQRQPYAYDLYRDGVTQSFINKFLTCKEQCRLEYVEGWTPRKEPIWFTYGKLIHEVLSKSYALGRVPSGEELTRFINAYESKMGMLNATDTQTKEIIFGLAQMIIPIYFQKYALDFEHQIIENEANFKVNIEEAAFFNKPIPISGRMDCAFLGKNDNVRIMDTKCLSMIDEDLAMILPLDTQIMLYSWAFTKLNPDLNYKGFILNIVKRPSHRMTQKDASIKDFCKRVCLDILSKMDEFFIRIPVELSLKEIEEWEHKFLIPVLCDIEQWWTNDCASYVNSGALITKYGHCPMFQLITVGDKTDYYKRNVPFGELE